MVKRGKSSGGDNWEEVPDLTSVPEDEIEDLLATLSAEEVEVSYRRRVLQGRIDLLRSELVRRGCASVSPDDLAQSLMGYASRETEKIERDSEHPKHSKHSDRYLEDDLGDNLRSGKGLG